MTPSCRTRRAADRLNPCRAGGAVPASPSCLQCRGKCRQQVLYAALAKNPQITNVRVTTGGGVVVLETCHRDRSVPAIRLAWIIMDEAGLEIRKCLADRIDVRSR